MSACVLRYISHTHVLDSIWNMEAENDTREAFRRDIRVEYERQRKIEQELWEQRQRCHAENWYSDASSVNTDHRRRKLIADKLNLSVYSQGSQRSEEPDENREGPALVQHIPSPLSRQPIKKRKVRIASPHNVVDFALADCVVAGTTKSPQHWNDMSSLMDSAFDDEGDDNGDEKNDLQDDAVQMNDETVSLVDVPL